MSGDTQPSLLEEARTAWSELRGLARDHLHLAVLETRRAGESLVRMVAIGFLVGLLLISAWLSLVGAGVFGLVALGLALPWAFLLVAGLNIAVAALLYLKVRRLARNLMFPATVQSLQPARDES